MNNSNSDADLTREEIVKKLASLSALLKRRDELEVSGTVSNDEILTDPILRQRLGLFRDKNGKDTLATATIGCLTLYTILSTTCIVAQSVTLRWLMRDVIDVGKSINGLMCV